MNMHELMQLTVRIGFCIHACSSAVLPVSRMLHAEAPSRVSRMLHLVVLTQAAAGNINMGAHFQFHKQVK